MQSAGSRHPQFARGLEAAGRAAPRITANRQRLDDKFPSLGFTVTTGELPCFEVLLTTDRSLFDPANAGRRAAATFYSSRQDGGLTPASGPTSVYLVPPAVLRGFADARPRPIAIYYTAVGYAARDGSGAVFAQPPASLVADAPSVALSPGFSARTLAAVLSVPVGRLTRTPHQDGNGHTYAAPYGYAAADASSDGYDDAGEGEDGFAADAAGPDRAGGPPTTTASRAWGPAPLAYDDWTPANGNCRAYASRAPASGYGHAGNGHARYPGAPTNGQAAGWTAPPPALPAAQAGWQTAGLDIAYDDGFGDADNPVWPGEAGSDAAPARSASAGAWALHDHGDGLDRDAYGGYGDGYEAGADLASQAQATTFPPGYPPPAALEAADDYDDGFDLSQLTPDDLGEAGAAYGDEADLWTAAPAATAGYSSTAAYAPAAGGSPHGGYPNGNGHGPAGAHPSAYAFDEYGYAHGAGAYVRSLGEELTIDARLAIVDRLARFESGSDRYAAINPDGEFKGLFRNHSAAGRWHVGLSYGIVQFTQDSGALGQLLTMMRDRDPDEFARCFGPSADELIRVTTAPGPSSADLPDGRSARVQPVDGADLWEEPWVSRFRAAAAHVPFQAAQNELASRNYIEPMLRFAGWLSLNTDRALTMVVDRAVHMGVGGGRRWVADAVGPISTPALRQQALAALGYSDLRSFQAATSGLTADNDWGPMTHAAMTAALRDLDASSPIPIPTRDQMLDAMVRRAAGTDFERRVRRLREATDFADTEYDL